MLRSPDSRARWVGAFMAIATFLLLSSSAKAAEEHAVRVAKLDPRDPVVDPTSRVPDLLGGDDIALYRAAFEAQRAARWSEADARMARLQDRLLLGHVLADRYLHARYRSSYDELRQWLEEYADLPQAERIYKLARSRQPAGAKAPSQPVEGYLGGNGQELARDPRAEQPRLVLEQGLQAWRRADFNGAALKFAQLANDGNADQADAAAAAFWAARAHLRAGRPQHVGRFLRVAANTGDPFYGRLAQVMLGRSPSFEWQELGMRGEMLDLLARYPGSRRAVGLAQVQQLELAEDEIRKLAANARVELSYALAALAAEVGLPAAQMRVALQMRQLDGRRHDGALYPIPEWQPVGGFRVDRALVYAVIRAESGFDVDAKSPRGAMGVMQVMPDTAAFVAKRHKVAYNGPETLLEPDVNMQVGQIWLRRLATTKTIDNSLIHLVTAYNAGESRLRSWLDGPLKKVADDPLLFIESVPISETRAYVKKVMGNLWAYRARLNTDSPELKAMAENRWPPLVAIDQEVQRLARKN